MEIIEQDVMVVWFKVSLYLYVLAKSVRMIFFTGTHFLKMIFKFLFWIWFNILICLPSVGAFAGSTDDEEMKNSAATSEALVISRAVLVFSEGGCLVHL